MKSDEVVIRDVLWPASWSAVKRQRANTSVAQRAKHSGDADTAQGAAGGCNGSVLPALHPEGACKSRLSPLDHQP